MSDTDSQGSAAAHEAAAPMIEIVYPLNEETEVPNTNGGLFKTVLVEGKGKRHPPSGANVRVHYVGTLASDGSKFDSSRDRGEAFTFTIGRGQVIKGWDQGVATMLKGEKAILKCTSEYAYGAAGSPPKIPPHATLNFEVELFGWDGGSEDVSPRKDGSVTKVVQDAGKDWDTPSYESVVRISKFTVVKPREEEAEDADADTDAPAEVLLERTELPWVFEVGATNGEDGKPVPPIVELCVKTMKRAERSVFTIRAAAVTGEADRAALGLDGPAKGLEEVAVEITLEAFTVVKTWGYQGAAKVAEGARRKDAGNGYFKAGQLSHAVAKYNRALEFVEEDYGFDTEEDKAAAKAVRIATLGNLAQCELGLKNYAAVITQCDKIISMDSSNLKAYFRKAKALFAQDEWDEAIKVLNALLALDPANADAQNELAAVKAKQQQYLQQQKKRFAGMFDKL
jgi:FK506-binding protein 4/5